MQYWTLTLFANGHCPVYRSAIAARNYVYTASEGSTILKSYKEKNTLKNNQNLYVWQLWKTHFSPGNKSVTKARFQRKRKKVKFSTKGAGGSGWVDFPLRKKKLKRMQR